MQTYKTPRGSPWPRPRRWDVTDILMTVDPAEFQFTSNMDGCDVIDQAFQRYRKTIFGR